MFCWFDEPQRLIDDRRTFIGIGRVIFRLARDRRSSGEQRLRSVAA
jgi:hypothetical protein